MQQKEEAAQAKAKQREQDLVAQLTAQAEARQMAAQAQWETESEKKTRAAIEPFKALLARTEKERDEASHQLQGAELGEKIDGSILVPQWLEKPKTIGRGGLRGWETTGVEVSGSRPQPMRERANDPV